jgi:hypothetical protein
MTYQIGPEMTQNQRQVLYGTVLGGSSIIKPKRGRNCYLAMRDRNYDWLAYKTSELRPFFKMDKGVIKQDKTTFRCYSVAYPIFNEIHDNFYKDGEKIVRKEILDLLTDVAWMVWFVDAGRKSKRKAYLRTQKFGEEGSEIIAEYFNELDCDCKVHTTRGRYEIVFSNQGAVEYLSTMLHRAPKFVLDRLEANPG